MELLKVHNPSGHYVLLDGDTNFHKEVNSMIKEHWVLTGNELNLEQAMWSVLADFYNRTEPDYTSSDIKQ